MIDHFLDIFSKLVIGVISFVAPVTSYMLSTYIGDRQQILKRLAEQSDITKSMLSKEIEIGVKPGGTTEETIKTWHKTLSDFEAETENSLNLLNFLEPKARISTIFATLFICIFSLLIDSLVRENVGNLYNHWLSVSLIAISLLSFTIALLQLRKIAWALIDAKHIVLKESKEIAKASISPSVQQIEIALPEETEGIKLD